MELRGSKRSRFRIFLQYIRYNPERFLTPLLVFTTLSFFITPSLLQQGYTIDTGVVSSDANECTFTSTVTSAHTKTISPGTTQSDIGTTKVTTKCTNSSDHQVYAIGYSNDTDGNTNLINSAANATIATGTATTGNVSNWAMKIAKDSSSYEPSNLTITNSFGSYHTVPSSSTQVSGYEGATDSSTGSSITTTYRAKISDTQVSGSYVGKVKYTLTATMIYDITIKTVTGISKVTLNGVECTSTSGCLVSGLTEDEDYELVATPATGYNFASWDAGTNGSVDDATSASTTYTVGSGNSTITPSVTAKQYTITLNGNGATTAGSSSTKATYGLSTLNAITRPIKEYTVSGFTLPASNNADGADVSSPSTITSSYTFRGWFKESAATNLIASNAATPVLASSTSYTDGNGNWSYDGTRTLYAGWTSQMISLPNITKLGYDCGWTETATNATTKDFQTGESLTPDRNYVLYGVCIPIDYTVTVTAGTGISTLALSGWTGTGSGTLTKTFHIGDTIDLTTFTRNYLTGFNGAIYGKYDNYGSMNGYVYTVGAGNGILEIRASGLDTPTCTMQGGTTKVYDRSDTNLIATDVSDSYASNSVDITYSFGYASSASGELVSFSEEQESNYYPILKNAFRGSRYYGVKVTVTSVDDNTIAATCTSGTGSGTGTTVTNRTTMTLVNSRVQLDVGDGTLNGTPYFYVYYGGASANKYSTRTGTTSYTLPTVTPPSGYTFDGWYTSGGDKVMNADFSLTGTAVSSWSNSSSEWVKTGTSDSSTDAANILYAHYTFNGVNIQNLSSESCTSTPSLAKDTRDGHVYTIQRLNDGNCWMMENLDLGRTTLTSDLTSSNTNLSATVTAATFNSWKKTSGTNTYIDGELINISSTDSTSGTPYGTLYNYYAASAGTTTGNSNSSNASYDICPAGWRLPTGGSSGEFQTLYANSSYNTNAKMRASVANSGAAFALAGSFSSNVPSSQGSVGYYWSSTRHNDTNMYVLGLDTSNILPSYNGLRYSGYAIRCILKEALTISSLTYLQDFKDLSDADKTSVLNSMSYNTTYNLIDNRDNKTYKVVRLKDDNIWLAENLDLGKTTLSTDLTSANTNISSTITASTFNNWKKNSGSSTYTAGEFMNITGTDSTSGNTYGTLYNYYAASAGTVSGNPNTNDALYDICPAGWRLPSGGAGGEFSALYNEYNSLADIRASIVNGGAAFAAAGWFGSSSANDVGTIFGYWSSTYGGNGGTNAYTLYYNSSLSEPWPNASTFRNTGYSVRCIARRPARTLTISYGTGVSSVKVNNIIIQNGGTISLESGLPFSITMTPSSGYVFSSWSATSGTIVSSSKQTTTYFIGSSSATLTANVEEAVFMQSITKSQCQTLTSNGPITAYDIRDYRPYLINYLADGNCWMLDNLAIGDTTSMLLTSDNTNITGSYTLPASTSSITSSTTAQLNITYKGVVTTKYGSGNGYLGGYYNYCALSAGTICSSSNSNNATQDICPKGWHLPTGGGSGQYQALRTATGSASAFNTALSTTLSGVLRGTTYSSRGSAVFYYSSTVYDSTSMYGPYITGSSAVDILNYTDRNSGWGARCVKTSDSTSTDINLVVQYGTGVSSVKVNNTTVSNGGSISLTPGSSYSITMTPSSGYTFSSWYATAGSVTSTYSQTTYYTPTTSNATLYAYASLSGTYMQNLSSSSCTTTASTVYDSRDGQAYTIKRLNDGKCWMLDNLNLGATTLSTSLTSLNTNITSTVTASTFNSWKKTSGSGTYTAGEFIPVSGTDSTSSTKYGTLYNYYAVTAGTINAADNFSNATSDICPAGWRLPTGGPSGEYKKLYTYYNSYALMKASASSGGAAFALAGYFYNSTPGNTGSSTNFWTSTPANNIGMYSLYLYSGTVYDFQYASVGRSGGAAIRCVLKETASKTISNLTYLQDFYTLTPDEVSSVKSSMSSNTTYTLRDSRDNTQYKIAKLADGRIWMIDNLNLGATTISTNLTISNTNTGLDVAYSTFNGWKKTTGTNSYTSPEYIPVSGTDSTSGIKYGTLYNYAAISAGVIATSSNNENAFYDICPAGWRLPTGGNSGEFQTLYNTLGSFSLMRAAVSSGGAAFALAGTFSDGLNGTPNNVGTISYYASSTVYPYSNAEMNALYININGAYPSSSAFRCWGQSVRCVTKY